MKIEDDEAASLLVNFNINTTNNNNNGSNEMIIETGKLILSTFLSLFLLI